LDIDIRDRFWRDSERSKKMLIGAIHDGFLHHIKDNS
jgi:hypothetical protein